MRREGRRQAGSTRRLKQPPVPVRAARSLVVGLAATILALALAGTASAEAWTNPTPSGTPPSPGYSQTGTSSFDAVNDRLVLFAVDDGTRPNDTWVLSGATGSSPTWTMLAPTGSRPMGRFAHSVVYAPTSNRLIIYGGCPSNCGFALDDVWVLTDANGLGGTPAWSQLAPSGFGFNSEGHVAVYDDANNRMIVFGGQQGFNAPFNAVRVLEHADGTGGTPAWTTLTPIGVPPAPREAVGEVYDAASNRMIVFGGSTLACCATVVATYNDVWVLKDANGLGTPEWIQLTPSGTPPPKREWASAVYDGPTNRLIVFGGADSQFPGPTVYYNDVWVLTHANGLGGTPTWSEVFPTGGPPTARFGQIAGYSSATNRMVFAMGRTDVPTFTLFNDVWVLSERPAKIAFASNRDGNFEVYSMEADGSARTRLTANPALDGTPGFSADGARIAFASSRTGNGDIYVMNADGSVPTRLTTSAAVDAEPSWSPDGTKIAFASGRTGNGDIYVMNADGSVPTRLTTSAGVDAEPSWSPDGTKIVFTSGRTGNGDVYVMNADGGLQTRLTMSAAVDSSPDWAPDGTKIAFASNRDGNFEVYSMEADGSAQTRLTVGPAFDGDPAFHATGKIAFTSRRDGNFEIYSMNGDGSGATRLTVNPAVDISPDAP
jgi:hypothetical protein